MIYGGVGKIQCRYTTGLKSTEMQTGENALLITFAQRVLPWLSFGANFKLLRYDLPITKSPLFSVLLECEEIDYVVKKGTAYSSIATESFLFLDITICFT